MSYLIDTHCHLHDPEFFTAEQAEEMVKRAHEKGVKKIVCIGTSHEDSLVARDFAAQHENIYWTYGIHPEEAGRVLPEPIFSDVRLEFLSTSYAGTPTEPSLRDEPVGSVRNIRVKNSNHVIHPKKQVSTTRPVAIGEVGLDYHYEGYDRDAQIKLFEGMLQLATDHDLPVSFHVREAFSDFFAVISNFPKIKGVVHSFSDNKKNLKRILNETNFYVGVNGLATYTTLPLPPLERILLETDAPFLTPKPFRGIINEPGYIYNIAKWLSEKMAMEFSEVENETTKNAKRLFDF
ncbi:TatD family hydrolase [Candidatus Saccharibacteria bacterium]|nr:TatD family hydrolase [Candidatus Saccharibacteria bacterium]